MLSTLIAFQKLFANGVTVPAPEFVIFSVKCVDAAFSDILPKLKLRGSKTYA